MLQVYLNNWTFISWASFLILIILARRASISFSLLFLNIIDIHCSSKLYWRLIEWLWHTHGKTVSNIIFTIWILQLRLSSVVHCIWKWLINFCTFSRSYFLDNFNLIWIWAANCSFNLLLHSLKSTRWAWWAEWIFSIVHNCSCFGSKFLSCSNYWLSIYSNHYTFALRTIRISVGLYLSGHIFVQRTFWSTSTFFKLLLVNLPFIIQLCWQVLHFLEVCWFKVFQWLHLCARSYRSCFLILRKLSSILFDYKWLMPILFWSNLCYRHILTLFL